jgi:hypothetical protein
LLEVVAVPLACVVPSLTLASLVTFTGSIQATEPAPPYGAESPQAVVAALERAKADGDPAATVAVISPRGRRELARESVTGVLMVLRFSDPDDQPPGSPPLAAAERDVKRRQYQETVDLARQALDPHGLGELIGRAPLSDEVAKALGSRLDRADTVSLLAGVLPLLGQLGNVLDLDDGDASPPFTIDLGPVSGYQVEGDRATAKAASETVEFERIDGRWYLAPPAAAPPGRR